jgi:eukaryotic-like serine/threonine-protein kinase
VPEKPDDKRSRGPLRALSDWLRGETPAPARTPSPAGAPLGDDTPVRDGLPGRIGHYRIVGKLGQGGMGVVYAARDEKLERAVALKTMSAVARDDTARKRFWREARAAASVNHPNVCQLFEIGEDRGELFIAMELLEGQSLAARLQQGPMSVAETLPIALGMLAALQALHARGIVHRDLKPSNVFLTPHGVKLLDFGLALPSGPAISAASDETPLTGTGVIVGTPRYMAPEQVTGEPPDARTDLFAAGAILFEMLAGRPAFTGRNAVEILHATLHEQPPALTGSPAVAAVDRVIRRALAKRPAERPASADAMAEELRAVRGVVGDDTPALARALTRIVVLPFRVLRPDPETDFLAFSLPDAIATSLSGIRSLVVRSSATAARFAGPGEAPDLKALAAEADVDRVVMGTLLRAGDQLRASTQLVEAPGGTLLSSHTVQSSLGDLFHLQDDTARRVVEALALPLGGETPPPTPDEPRDARAYQLFLRANELARGYDHLPEARDLYQRCLELDPKFAPAWARLGRCHWVIGKYLHDPGDSAARAEEAFRRALDLNPRLAVAHRLYASFEADSGHSLDALVRLLGEGRRHGNDAELFAGLVHAARYCGLNEQAMAAHEEARRLDPNAITTVAQTMLMTGDFDRLLALDVVPHPSRGDDVDRALALGLSGRYAEARPILDELRAGARSPAFAVWLQTLMAWIDRRPEGVLAGVQAFDGMTIAEDPEGLFQVGWMLSDLGDREQAVVFLRRAIDRGYYVAPTLTASPAFDVLREDPAFLAVLADAEAGRGKALAAYREAGGEELLGMWAAAFDRLDALLKRLPADDES